MTAVAEGLPGVSRTSAVERKTSVTARSDRVRLFFQPVAVIVIVGAVVVWALSSDLNANQQETVCVVMRDEFSRQHPEIATVMQPIAAALSNEEMIELGKKVDVDGEDPGIVAKDWMVSKGFIGADTG